MHTTATATVTTTTTNTSNAQVIKEKFTENIEGFFLIKLKLAMQMQAFKRKYHKNSITEYSVKNSSA